MLIKTNLMQALIDTIYTIMVGQVTKSALFCGKKRIYVFVRLRTKLRDAVKLMDDIDCRIYGQAVHDLHGVDLVVGHDKNEPLEFARWEWCDGRFRTNLKNPGHGIESKDSRHAKSRFFSGNSLYLMYLMLK